MPPAYFLSCDWGTSHFRLRFVEPETLRVLAETTTTEGAGAVGGESAPEARRRCFEQILTGHARELFQRVGASAGMCVVSGMASSTIGWMNLPYACAPVRLAPECLTTHILDTEVAPGQSLRVVLVSGVRTGQDVMRGEETELLGLVGLLPAVGAAKSACVILPGTHSKHVRLEAGVLTAFTTYMTGELYAHLQTTPTLRGCLTGADPFCESEFLAGVDQVRAEGIMASLFRLRARAVLASHGSPHAASFLSGMLIGAELMDVAATREAEIHLGGSSTLTARYVSAAERCQLPLRAIDPAVVARASIHAHAAILHHACPISTRKNVRMKTP